MADANAPTPSQWILAIDSSTVEAGVALTDGERWAELNWLAGRDQTVSILEQIDRMLTLMGLEVTDLAAVAVATGPGMFSGLRVGMGIAKGLVLGVDLPLIGISTLEATALPFVGLSMPVVATVAAGRGRLVWASFAGDETGALSSLVPARNGTIEELAIDLDRYHNQAIVTGELDERQIAVLRTVRGVMVPPEWVRCRRSLSIAEIAVGRFARKQFDNATTLEPIYLHARPNA